MSYIDNLYLEYIIRLIIDKIYYLKVYRRKIWREIFKEKLLKSYPQKMWITPKKSG